MNERLSLILIRLIFKSYILHIYLKGKFQYSEAMGNKCFFFFRKTKNKKQKQKNDKKTNLLNGSKMH
jgi:hypothetical protein